MLVIHFSQAQAETLAPLSEDVKRAANQVLRSALQGDTADLEAAAAEVHRAKDALHAAVARVLGVPLEEVQRFSENPDTPAPMTFLN